MVLGTDDVPDNGTGDRWTDDDRYQAAERSALSGFLLTTTGAALPGGAQFDQELDDLDDESTSVVGGRRGVAFGRAEGLRKEGGAQVELTEISSQESK